MIVATVLRSGGDYGPKWVYALKAGIAAYLKTPHRFVVLADMDVPGVDSHHLAHDWPGWWSKIELFTPGLFDGPVLYMDLDTLPVGWLLDLVSCPKDLALLSDLWHPERAQSGVMFFRPGPHTRWLYEGFESSPQAVMRRFRGDGEYVASRVPGAARLQDLYPGQIVSLKPRHEPGRRWSERPENARLVCGHGNPRLSDPRAGWAHEMWRERAA